jgi:hypothetical protein
MSAVTVEASKPSDSQQDVAGINDEAPLAVSGSRDDVRSKDEATKHLLVNDQIAGPGGRPTRPSLATDTAARRHSFIDEEDDPVAITPGLLHPASAPKEAPVTWSSLPKKGQLAVLTIARLSEPLTERSLAAYLFYQLKFFNPNLPDSTIASQGGMFTAAFAAAQFLTAVWWGRAADTPWIGRKRVLLVGLFGTCVSCLGVGFSTSFAQALFFRACAGCLNGNVGVMRTMISEIIKEKKCVMFSCARARLTKFRYQSRAFLLLPMCFNIGMVSPCSHHFEC